MKKYLMFILLVFPLCLLCACNNESKEQIKAIWKTQYQNEFVNLDLINDSKVFYDGSYIDDTSISLSKRKDVKYEFTTDNHTLLVNSSDGYTLTFPSNEVSFDYSLSKYRIQALDNDSITTISYEKSSPYGNSSLGWNTYLNEWVIRYIDNPIYLEDNNLEYTQKPTVTSYGNYELITYSIVINDHENIEYPYYNISILREKDEYIEFYLFVTKSKVNNTSKHLEIVQSLKKIESFGTSSNHLGSLELVENPLWSDETKNYFDYLNLESTFDFGFFRWSLPDDTDTEYRDLYLQRAIDSNQEILDTMDYAVEIIPTYTHLGWYEEDHFFPTHCANTLATGNGFNGKPVLQFTFQFTRNNNNVSIYNTTNNYTPMFDILRGNYDDYFRTLAEQIKAYEKPVLFRLNNEMNTDWTSYCGLITLLDPDIFRETWIRMYEIFNEVGVDNCIWIFNPVATTCPYSSWGEDLCYMPGINYVQALGITHYEMLNSDFYFEFSQSYNGALYQKNKEVWANFPWIISEFGCGSGGNSNGEELYRNQEKQAEWVSEMLEQFANKSKYPYLKKISVAIWFNSDDINGDGTIENALNINSNLPLTIKAFKDGFKKISENENKDSE